MCACVLRIRVCRRVSRINSSCKQEYINCAYLLMWYYAKLYRRNSFRIMICVASNT